MYFLIFATEKWLKTRKKCVLSLISKSLQDIHMGTIGFIIPKNMGIYIKIVTLYARAQVMAKYVISMAAILNVS